MKLLIRVVLFVFVAACLTTLYYVLYTHRGIYSRYFGNANELQKKNDFNRCYNTSKSKHFSGIEITKTNKEEVENEIHIACLYNVSKRCLPGEFLGRLKVPMDSISYDLLSRGELQFVHDGGWWRPSDCIPTQQTAVIIPFRNREEHLPILLRQLHPILRRQRLHYRIFVIEQADNHGFNRAKLINVGFREIRKLFPFSCFVFHDVDLVPEDDRIDYSCKKSPMHLAAAVSTFGYRLFSEKLFGGVVMFTVADFERVNGFSNIFWVWGGEDDILYERVLLKKMVPQRENITIARYKMLPHKSVAKSRSDKDFLEMKKSMKIGLKYSQEDGLNSLTYNLTEMTINKLYTLLKVDLLKAQDKEFSVQ